MWENRDVTWKVGKSDRVYDGTWGTIILPAGSYTADVYLVDVEGNKSKTLSTTFKVTE